MKTVANFTFFVLLVTSNVFGQFATYEKSKPNQNDDPNNLIYGSNQASHRKLQKQVQQAQSPTTCTGSWTNQSGPFGISGAYAVATDPTGNLVLASTFSGIVRSTDGGNIWQYIGGFSNIYGPNGAIGAIAMDPVNSNKLIAGEGTNETAKVFLSDDGGLTWTQKSHPSSVFCVDISKANHNRVISGSNSYQNNLAKSSDGGNTWSAISLPNSTTGRVWAVKFHPTDQNKVFAGGEMGLFYSADFGNTWTELNNGIPNTDYISIWSIEFSPTNADSIVVSCNSANGPYISANGGQSWVSIRNNLWQYEVSLDVHYPKWDSEQLLMGTGYTGLYQSQLIPVNWQNVSQLNSLSPGIICDIETSTNQKIYLGTMYNGFFCSHDGGATYTKQVNGISCAETRCVKIDPNNPMKAIAVGWSGMYMTSDLGATWQELNNSGAWLSVDISKSNSDICFAAGGGPSIMRSADGGLTWINSANGVTGQSMQFIKIAIDPNNPDRVIALSHFGSDNTVYQTFDGGSNWKKASGIPSDAGAYFIQGIVYTPQSVFVATDNGLYKSVDNGITWNQAYPGAPQSMCTTMFNGTMVLCGFSGSGIYYSADQGSNWPIMLASPGNIEILDFRINPQNSDEILLVNMNNECYYTDDGGQIWQLQSDGLFCDYIYSLEVDFANKTRYAPTTGNSVFQWADPTPTYPGNITGSTSVCQGQNDVTYSVPVISNANSYVWTLPDGATGTSTNNSITVNYGVSAVSGAITVYGTNTCGDGPSSTLSISVNTVPSNAGTISGNSTACQGQKNVTYSVPAIENATSYVWLLPDGATGTSTTNSITVNYGIEAVSGDVTVFGTNDCGGGTNSSLAIIVNNKPITPEISINGNVLHSNAPSGNQWYDQNGFINDATNPDYTINANGDYFVIVTLLGCSSDSSNILQVRDLGIELFENSKTVNIYPNPVSDELIIEIKGCNEKMNFEILNVIGQVVFKGNLVEKTSVQTRNLEFGTYLIKLENGEVFEFRKIIKQ